MADAPPYLVTILATRACSVRFWAVRPNAFLAQRHYSSNMNSRAAVILSSLAILSVSACSSSSNLNVDDGWDWEVRRDAAFNVGAQFDYFTGEVVKDAGEAGSGLSLKDESPEPDTWKTALADAERAICDGYVNTPIDDTLKWQGYDIRFLISGTINAAMADKYPDGWSKVNDELVAWNNANGPSFKDYETGTSEWKQVVGQREALRVERIKSEYPELAATADENRLRLEEFSVEANTTAMVLAAQKYYIEVCDLDVAEGYKYPSPAELGIVVDEEYEKSVEEANA